MSIQLAESDLQILGCFPVISQLRPHLEQTKFVEQIRYQMKEGYQIVFLEVEKQAVAVAGFRISNCLALGKFLYIDDLIVDELKRSHSYGKQLFQWLIEYAKNHDCKHLSLDSGVQRYAAHRFYLMQRMSITSHHFSMEL
ncbi:GNAT family N-acetyltransferase [Nostoc sp. UCD121]|uniref:GNAT family N-acetyltransferase n=1 Tax=unclassified Nostoc TaxID=2593658 RepID=UPI001627276D|nr:MULTISPECIES: GNAT family N-acetyltransferase [unclassified Nostoc]MBC1219580.1 GNAT family N-acetyltransferase [Nostoc sp. UCD120]MBC1278498.1 GNAT family N-acetyltransferase [Nostoc sp. UCD121]MBC1297765.1 GNAT family N-acetyltransferase [Nostoc sp. UCD122]